VVLIQSIVIFKKKRVGGYILKIITKLYVTPNDDTTSFCYKSLITILVVFSLLNVVNVVNGFHRKFWLKSALHLNIAVFTLNFLPYTGPVSSNIYRPEFQNYINDH
jgi:hypothetical protein